MTVLFISDLHLQARRPDIAGQFLHFLETQAREAEALYILGDLFEAWIGDDDPAPDKRQIVSALRDCVERGTPGFFMRGNRDFLIGDKFAEDSGLTVLEDPSVVELYGKNVLLMHGDTLCTDDEEYQAFRRMVRDPAWQAQMLALPVEQRRQLAAQARDASHEANKQKAADIMDVNQAAVEQALAEADVDILLHGHTHRPAVHKLQINRRECTRIVLGDWYEHGSVVRWDASGYTLAALPRT